MDPEPAGRGGKRVGQRIAAAAPVLVSFVVIGFVIYQDSTPRRRELDSRSVNYPLSVESGCLELGTVWEQPEFPWELPIRNDSQHDVSITGYVSSCACAKIEPQQLTIPAGCTRDIHLTIDLQSSLGEDDLSPERELRIRIAPKTANGRDLAGNWVMRGHVRTALKLRQMPRFIDRSEKAQPIPPLVFDFNARVPVRGIRVTVSNSDFLVEVERFTPENVFRVTVRAAKALARGSFTFKLAVRPEVEGGESVPPGVYAVSGEIVADIQPTPKAVNLGAIPLGFVGCETIVFASLTNEKFTVKAVDNRDAGLAIRALDGRPDTFVITQSAVATGPKLTTAHFEISDERTSETVSIPVRYHGLMPSKEAPR